VKLLVDMNLSPRWVATLGDAGHEAVHWSTAGSWTASDQEIMLFARDNEYIVLTHDLDFGDILAATNGAKPSVVQIRSAGLSVARIGAQVVAGLALCAEELAAGALVTIDASRTRVRLLPLPFGRAL
jgi:predicted nuclease of predicted toxin-antitoxin system